MKRGYTLIEVMLTLSCLTAIIIGGFVLYGQYTSVMSQQTKISEEGTQLNEAFLAINSAVQYSKYIDCSDYYVDLGNATLEISNNCLYIDTQLLLETDKSMYFESDTLNKYIILHIGGEELCFRSASTETYHL